MRLFVLGATGGNGRQLIAQGLERGHRFTAFVRSPEKLPRREGLAVCRGDPRNVAELTAALPGHDAVVSSLGPPGTGPTTIVRDAAHSTVAAMRAAGVGRLLIVSAALVFDDAGFLARILSRTLLRHVTEDCAAMEATVKASGLDWMIVRPPRLTNGPLTRNYITADGRMPPGKLSMSRADVACFLLDELERREHSGRIVGLTAARK